MRYNDWAIVATFGDNLTDVANELCEKSGYGEEQISLLSQLGVCINYNYNGYGMAESDFFHPADLYRVMNSYTTPFLFVADRPDIVNVLVQGYAEDMAKASRFISINEDSDSHIYIT